MYRFPNYLRVGLTLLLLAASGQAFALSGSGDSAPGDLDTVAPNPGTATIPSTGVISGETISYTGASDTSGIARVELWSREDSSSWFYYDANLDGLTSGSFSFVPGTTGLYHFDLVAQDSLGNRSNTPSGSTGTGQGSTNFTSTVADWSVLE